MWQRVWSMQCRHADEELRRWQRIGVSSESGAFNQAPGAMKMKLPKGDHHLYSDSRECMRYDFGITQSRLFWVSTNLSRHSIAWGVHVGELFDSLWCMRSFEHCQVSDQYHPCLNHSLNAIGGFSTNYSVTHTFYRGKKQLYYSLRKLDLCKIGKSSENRTVRPQAPLTSSCMTLREIDGRITTESVIF